MGGLSGASGLSGVSGIAGATTGISDADALDFISRVETADGQTLESGVRTAIEAFIVGCKADASPNAGVSNFQAIEASCLLMGARTLGGALVPLKGAAPTNFNFVSGDYSRSLGLLGNGVDKYLSSNRNQTADPQNNKHLAVFRSVAATNDAGLIGGSPPVAGLSHLYTGLGSFFVRLNSSGAFGVTLTTHPGAVFYGASRQNSAGFSVRIGQTSYSHSAASSTPVSDTIRIFFGQGFTNARLSYYSIGNAVDLTLLENRVIALRNAIAAALP